MSIFTKIFDLLFPASFSYTTLTDIPQAPRFSDRNVYSLYDYHNPLGKKLVYYIKKFDDTSMSRHLAEIMYDHLLADIAEAQEFGYFKEPLLMTVPMTKRQYIKRGFHQTKRIARFLAGMLNGTYEQELVKKIRETKKQALIKNKHERFNNVRNCFTVNTKKIPLLAHKDIIVVDDLVTTGATFYVLQKLCKKHKARKVILITIAH